MSVIMSAVAETRVGQGPARSQRGGQAEARHRYAAESDWDDRRARWDPAAAEEREPPRHDFPHGRTRLEVRSAAV